MYVWRGFIRLVVFGRNMEGLLSPYFYFTNETRMTNRVVVNQCCLMFVSVCIFFAIALPYVLRVLHSRFFHEFHAYMGLFGLNTSSSCDQTTSISQSSPSCLGSSRFSEFVEHYRTQGIPSRRTLYGCPSS